MSSICLPNQSKYRCKSYLCLEHIELPAKLLDYLLRSDTSTINQSELGDAFACACVYMYSLCVGRHVTVGSLWM